MNKISGLGVEHEIVIYTGHKLYKGSDIKSLYYSAPVSSKKRERRNIKETLHLIEDNYNYNVDQRLSSLNFTLYIRSIQLYIIPKLLGEPMVRPLDKDITDELFASIIEFGKGLEPIINKIIQNDPKSKSVLLNMKKGVDIDWNNIGRYSEFITQDPFNKTIGEIVQQLTSMELLFLKIVKKSGFVNAYYPSVGTSQFIEFTNQKNQFVISGDYNGSYHINITLPYLQTITYDEFAYRHFYAMLTLQWFEPLLLSLWGQPDAYAFGDDGMFVQGSYRMMVNSFSGVGTVKLNLSKFAYVSELVAYFDSLTERKPNPNQLNTRPGIDNDLSLRKGYPNPVPETDIYTPGIGADFRRGDLKDKQDLMDKRYFGFEFRILDNIPTAVLPDVLRILYLLCDHSFTLYNKDYDLQNPTHNKSWNSILDKIFHYGHHAALTKQEIIDFLKSLQLDYPDIQKYILQYREAGLVFKAIVSILYKTYGTIDGKEPKGEYSKVMAKDEKDRYYKKAPLLPNLNRRAFDKIIETFNVNPVNGKYRGFIKYLIDGFVSGKTFKFDTLLKKVEKEYPDYAAELINSCEYLQSKNILKIKRTKGNISSLTIV